MDLQERIAKLREAIRVQKSLRGILPTEQVEATLRDLEAQLARLEAQLEGSGALAQGDRATAVGERAVHIRGRLTHSLVNTGVLYQIYQMPPGQPRLSEAAFQRFLRDYLIWVRDFYGRARLYGERSPRPRKRSLGDIFLPLTLQRVARPSRGEVEQWLRRLGGDGPRAEYKAYQRALEARRQGARPIKMADLLTLHPRLAIIGGAGSGKSTLLSYLAWALAVHELEERPLPFRLPQGRKALVPLVIPLRYRQEYLRLYRQTPARGLEKVREGTLAGFIFWWLKRHSGAVPVAEESLAEEFFERLLRGGGCLVMLDGLDEVTNARERGRVRQEVEDLAQNQYPNNIFIVTARAAGYKENAVFDEDFLRLDVQDLDEEQIATLVRRWCEQLYPASQVQDEVNDIMGAIRDLNARYRQRNQPPLIRTPLLVTMVVSVKWDETELPRERARLYESVVRVMLQAQYLPEDESRQALEQMWSGTWEEQRDWLSYLAWEMHRGGRDGAAITEARLREILRRRLPPSRLNAFVEAVYRRGGLLEERAGLFQFAHLTFQEFLAARYVAKARKPQWLAPYLHESWWREVILLTYGFAKVDYAPFAQDFLNWLVAQGLHGAELAGAAVLDIERPDPQLRNAQALALAAALSDPSRSASGDVRARAGKTLDALGDPRFGPERFYLPVRRWDPATRQWINEDSWGFVGVPAGPFWMGSDPKTDAMTYRDEQPRHKMNLEYDYWIARYPVTVAQWRAFVEATGYGDFSPSALRDPDNHPVRWINWYDALAYARWLDQKLKEVSQRWLVVSATLEERQFWAAVASGRYQITLPSEAEWEKAARGVDGRIYPWGKSFDPERANTREAQVGDITAVGAFPKGASPYGLLDLSGNVWEWTRSLWGPYPYPQEAAARRAREDLSAPKDVPRVLRGGSFDSNHRNVRGAVRDHESPDSRLRSFGFRVALAPVVER